MDRQISFTPVISNYNSVDYKPNNVKHSSSSQIAWTPKTNNNE